MSRYIEDEWNDPAYVLFKNRPGVQQEQAKHAEHSSNPFRNRGLKTKPAVAFDDDAWQNQTHCLRCQNPLHRGKCPASFYVGNGQPLSNTDGHPDIEVYSGFNSDGEATVTIRFEPNEQQQLDYNHRSAKRRTRSTKVENKDGKPRDQSDLYFGIEACGRMNLWEGQDEEDRAWLGDEEDWALARKLI